MSGQPALCDIHEHLIYGVDDGARTFEQMTAMLEAARANNVSVVAATAHITPGRRLFPSDAYF